MAGFLDSLIGTESGGNWQARNNAVGAGGMAGHFGRLQFGKARLQDAMRAGVIPQGMTPEQFMADPASQQKVEAWHFGDIDSQAQRMGLDRYIGQTVSGIPVTQDAIRAMAHLGGIGGAAKFLNTGGKYNPSDAYGTSLADYATKHGGAGGMQVQGGGGLLTAAGGGAQDQLAPEPKKGLLGFLSNPDARARLAIALEGMTLNPNEAFMQSMQQGIQTRGETKAATEAKNKTAAWLRSQGREDLAAAVEGGIVSGSDAFAAMRPGEPVKGVSVGNNLVNPITGEVIYTGAEGSNTPSSFLALDMQAQAAGLAKGSPEYQQFMLTGGAPQSTMPAAFVALDQQAQAAGFVPGSAEYKQFMATRGAGLVEAAKLTATAQTEAQIAAPADIAAAEKIIGEIDAVRNDPALAMATGASSVLNQIPGTPGYDFQNRVNQLASGAFLTAIDQMRGMGALSNAEGQTATRAITRLNTATSEAEFKSALSDYEAIVKTGLERAKAKVAPAAAAPAAPADTGGLSESDLQYLGAP